MPELPHLRATCAAIMQERRAKEAEWQAAADRERQRDDWFDDLRDNAALIAWVVVAVALGVFLFVAMAVL